jgi:hypothetical protein
LQLVARIDDRGIEIQALFEFLAHVGELSRLHSQKHPSQGMRVNTYEKTVGFAAEAAEIHREQAGLHGEVFGSVNGA